MRVNRDRIGRAQQLMTEHGMVGLMIMTHDDYIYFFGESRTQPRAIIPVSGPPILIAFAAEEPELRRDLGDLPIMVFKDIAEQMSGVRQAFRDLVSADLPSGLDAPWRVGMQLWFKTPAFLVDMFRKLNRSLQVVSSDPVMDELRMVKEPIELDCMREAQAIAALGMGRAREAIRAGVAERQVAAEVMYAMLQAGADGTSTPIYVNSGPHSCWIHGTAGKRLIESGDLVVVDLTPQVEGYCANLARTFVIGAPSAEQALLHDTYLQMRRVTRAHLKPGVTSMELDRLGGEICQAAGLGDFHINGIAHGIGLRFEEIPASTIIKGHRRFPLREGMTVAVGHTILAQPGVGGVRLEDVYRVTPTGGETLVPYPQEEWVIE